MPSRSHRRLLVCFAASLLLVAAAPPVPPWLPQPPQREPVFPHLALSAEEVARGLAAGQIVAVDGRDARAYEAGHLPGAAWVSPDRLAGAAVDLGRLRSLLGRAGLSGSEVVVLAGSADRAETGRLFWLLEAAGCREVRLLEGGFPAWEKEGGKVETGRAGRKPVPFAAAAERETGAGLGWLRDRFGLPGVEVLDLRGEEVWAAFADRPGVRAGHIPHSLPFNPASLLPPNGGWPDAAEARQILGKIGPRDGDFIDLDAEVVLYGDGPDDPRLGLAYLLLRSLDVHTRVYAGGWQEWSGHAATPVVRIVSTGELRQLLAALAPGAADPVLPDRVVLDLRGDYDYQLAHLPGSRSLPVHLLGTLNEVVDRYWPGADRARTPVIFYCYGRMCIRSRNACSAAAHEGFQNLIWYRDGIPGWQRAGLPVVRPAP